MLELSDLPGQGDESTVASRLVVHDLGPLSVEVDDQAAAIRGVKPSRILAILLVNANRRVSVDTLVDVLWADEVSDLSSGTLESHIWRLRKVLEPRRQRRQDPTYLVNDAGGYRLAVGPANADSLRFVQLAEQGDRLLASGDPARALGRYDLALTLWRGRPFDVIADEDRAAAAVARLEETHEQLNEQRIDALLRLGAAQQAIGALGVLISGSPFRERLRGQLMLALYRTGRVEESLDVYHRARETLVDTLGIEPGAALRDLQQRILDRDPALTPAPSSAGPPVAGPSDGADDDRHVPIRWGEVHLPSRLSALVGREAELDRVGRLLQQARLVTLVGAAGCGKTRLAIEVARASTHLAPDGVWFIDLAAVEDPRAIPDVTMSTIGLEPLPAGTSLQALRGYVRDRQVLLVIDNCEHLLPAVYGLLDALLDGDVQSRILATSREPVGLDGEILWTLAPLPVHRDPTAITVGPSSSAQLFLARAQSADPTFQPTAVSMVEIEAICAAVDGIPLAIELAAGRIRSANLGEVRVQVGHQLAGLTRVGYNRTEHHRTVEAAIEWSVRLLSGAEQITHARLSVLPGVFTAEAASAVVGAAGMQPSDVPDLLAQLVHRSLLTVVPGEQPGEPTRFRQLATVRAHASMALTSSGESAATRARRAAFITDHVANCPPLEAEDITGWYATTEHNHDTFVAVLQDTLHDNPSPSGAHLVARTAAYWFRKERVSEGIGWLQAALSQGETDPADRVRAQLALAILQGMRDRTDLSLSLVQSALAKSGAVRDPRFIAVSLTSMAWIAWLRGDVAFGFLAREVSRLGDDDRRIGLMAELLIASAGLLTEGPTVIAARADRLRQEGLDLGNFLAAWLASWLAAGCALISQDAVTGLDRIQQVDNIYRRLGGSPGGANFVEFQANFEAIAGNPERAASLFGRASRLAFRAGLKWPISPQTEPVLAQLRRQLPADRLDLVWQSGDDLTRLLDGSPPFR